MAEVQADLATLLGGLGGTPFGDWAGVTVRGIATDSRLVAPDFLFVALAGQQAHGLQFVQPALEHGASALVLPAGATPPSGACGLLHQAPERVLAQAAERLYQAPANDLRLYGVTGTNGKTTTALLIASLLEAAGQPTAYWTTTLVRVGETAFRPKWTTPPAHELQRFLRSAVNQGARSVAMEVTSHAMRLGRVQGLRYAAGVAMNVTPDHLDFHPTFADYVAAKRAFIAGLDPDAAAFLCADDDIVRGFAASTRAHAFRFGLAPDADIRADAIRTDASGIRFVARVRHPELRRMFGAHDVRLHLPMVGQYNVRNALAALGVGIWAGIGQEAAERGMAGFVPPPRRLELQRIGAYTVLNDVAMNEASYDAVLGAVADLGSSPVVVVHAPRGQRGPDLNARIGRILGRWNRDLQFAPLVVSLSRAELQRYPIDHQVRHDELAALLGAAHTERLAASVHEDLEGAIREGVSRLSPGGILVLLGTFGMDDGPALAEAMLRERMGLAPHTGARRYLDPSDGSF